MIIPFAKAYLTHLIDEEIYLIEPSLVDEFMIGFDENYILYFFQSKHHKIVPENEQFLNKVLEAVQSQLLDGKGLKYKKNHQVETFEGIIPKNIKRAAIFGNQEATIEKYKVKTSEGSQSFFADSLDKIRDNAALKKQLWDSFKEIFE